MLPTQIDTRALYYMYDSLGSLCSSCHRAFHCPAQTHSAQRTTALRKHSHINNCLFGKLMLHYSIFFPQNRRFPFGNRSVPTLATSTCLRSTLVKRGLRATQSREPVFQVLLIKVLHKSRDVSGCTASQYGPLGKLSVGKLVSTLNSCLSLNISAEKLSLERNSCYLIFGDR